VIYDITNPQHRAVLQAARSWGVSPSVFTGRVLTTITRTAADGAQISTTEPAWTEEDTVAALQLQEYENDLCPGCHHPLAETTDPAKEFAYKATPPIRCHRCTASGIAGDQAQELPQPSALFIPVVLRETQS